MIQLLRNGILLRVSDEPAKTSGGLLLLTAPKNQLNVAQVVITGPGRDNEPVQCQTGDRIKYSSYGSIKVEIEGEKLLYITERDLIAVL